MNVKELAELYKEKRYLDFYEYAKKMSPRVMQYLFDYIDYIESQKTLRENTSNEQFVKWRDFLVGDTEPEYLLEHNYDLYTLSEEEKRQACLI